MREKTFSRGRGTGPHKTESLPERKTFALTRRRSSVKKNNFIEHLAAGVAQLVEQLICNQQVAGSSPIASSRLGTQGPDCATVQEGFPSGQRGQTVNLLAQPSEVRILPPPPHI